jgi:hypothetical protein
MFANEDGLRYASLRRGYWVVWLRHVASRNAEMKRVGPWKETTVTLDVESPDGLEIIPRVMRNVLRRFHVSSVLSQAICVSQFGGISSHTYLSRSGCKRS